MPPDAAADSPPVPAPHPSAPLADILGTLRSLTTFSSLARSHASAAAAARLADPAARTTVLAPLNTAVDALPRKLWESPGDYAALGPSAYEGDPGRDRADLNLRRFLDAHLVPVSPWPQRVPAKTLAGRELWWEDRHGKRLVMPDEVEVDRVASHGANGEVWILKGVLKQDV